MKKIIVVVFVLLLFPVILFADCSSDCCKKICKDTPEGTKCQYVYLCSDNCGMWNNWCRCDCGGNK